MQAAQLGIPETTFGKVTFALRTAIGLGVAIFLIWTGKYYEGEHCTKPLDTWCLVYGSVILSLTVIFLLIAVALGNAARDGQPPTWISPFVCLLALGGLFSVAW
eukprot:TRINITY_DN3132_c0_g1_i10.p1 TRINITY_DN3132_c0_g1~~TRINITY_DN3132_c0_g1_i10.p1  ORF type:complete len:104 (-),score=13.60 TRINITY_DN3132_c0_g1_i10:73-384(-)